MLSFIVNLYDRLISIIINFVQIKTVSELVDGVVFYSLPPVSAHIFYFASEQMTTDVFFSFCLCYDLSFLSIFFYFLWLSLSTSPKILKMKEGS